MLKGVKPLGSRAGLNQLLRRGVLVYSLFMISTALLSILGHPDLSTSAKMSLNVQNTHGKSLNVHKCAVNFPSLIRVFHRFGLHCCSAAFEFAVKTQPR